MKVQDLCAANITSATTELGQHFNDEVFMADNLSHASIHLPNLLGYMWPHSSFCKGKSPNLPERETLKAGLGTGPMLGDSRNCQ